jgi:hypothetical protein
MRRTKFEGANGVPNESDKTRQNEALIISDYCLIRKGREVRRWGAGLGKR